jgi:amino acid permease
MEDIGSLMKVLPGYPGKLLPIVVNISMWSTLWLTLVGYIVTIADALGEFWPGHREDIVIISSLVIMPLCFFDMSRLSIMSTISLIVVANLSLITTTDLIDKSWSDSLPSTVCWFGFGQGLVSMVSMTGTSMIIQMCAMPMYAELDDRTPEKFERLTRLAFLVLFIVYAGYAIIGYLTYGPVSLKSNILQNLPHGQWGKASRLAYVLVISAAYPMFVYPMISSIRHSESLRRRGFNIDLLSSVATVFISLSVLCGALIFTELGFINNFVGAVQCAIFVGIAPGYAGIYLLGEKSRHRKWRVLMVLLMIVCSLLGMLGVVFTDNYVKDLDAHCIWETR